LPVASTPIGPLAYPHKIKIKNASFGAIIFKLRKAK